MIYSLKFTKSASHALLIVNKAFTFGSGDFWYRNEDSSATPALPNARDP